MINASIGGVLARRLRQSCKKAIVIGIHPSRLAPGTTHRVPMLGLFPWFTHRRGAGNSRSPLRKMPDWARPNVLCAFGNCRWFLRKSGCHCGQEAPAAQVAILNQRSRWNPALNGGGDRLEKTGKRHSAFRTDRFKPAVGIDRPKVSNVAMISSTGAPAIDQKPSVSAILHVRYFAFHAYMGMSGRKQSFTLEEFSTEICRSRIASQG